MVVEEVQRKVEQAARNGFPAPGNVFFRQMQTAYATDQHRRIRFKLVNFTGFIGIANGAVDGVAQVDLPVDNFPPVRREGVFEVRHKHFDVSVHGVDHHFALYRAGDLYAAILQIVRYSANFPFTVANGSSFRNKPWQLAVIDFLLLMNACRQQLITLWRKAGHQFSQKLYRFGR